MRNLLGALTLLLVMVAPVAAAERVPLDTSRPPELIFNAQRFGSAPPPEMVCVHGHCRPDTDPTMRPVRVPYSSYELSGGLNHFAGFAIEPPRYSYWEDRLYRVFFRVQCDPEAIDACFDALAAEFDARYGLTFVEKRNEEIPRLRAESHVRRYVTRSGALVAFSYRREGPLTELPRVEIIDHGTAERVALASNPRYKAKTFLVPAGYASR